MYAGALPPLTPERIKTLPLKLDSVVIPIQSLSFGPAVAKPTGGSPPNGASEKLNRLLSIL